jgi:DNA-binding transcriptional MerR regulator
VLRFGESRFAQIKPLKRAGGRRYYRPDDVNLLRGIKHLLYGVGYTIKGARGVLSEQGLAFVQEVWRPGAPQPPLRADGNSEEHAAQLAPDDAARTLFGLLRAPSIPQAEENVDVAPGGYAVAEPTPPAALTHDDVRRLQSALHELRECRRVIDAALSGEAA